MGIFLANLARSHEDRSAPRSTIITGQFIEPGPTVVLAVFLFLGSTVTLYLKARFGPGPFLFATIFASICLDICLTTTATFPYPFYDIGKAIVIPLGLHSALSIISTVVIFPSTITAQFTGSIRQVLDPIGAALAEHRKILKMESTSADFLNGVNTAKGLIVKSEGGLTAAGVWFRLLPRDIIWGRFSPDDIGRLHWWVRRLVTRSEGMNIYYTLIDSTRERFPVTPAPTVPNTPAPGSRPLTPVATPTYERSVRSTPVPSRPQTPVNEEESEVVLKTSTRDDGPRRRNLNRGRAHSPNPIHVALSHHLHHSLRRHRHHSHSHSNSASSRASHDSNMHFSLLQLAHSLAMSHVANESTSETAVGVFESQRYLALESARLSSPHDEDLNELFVQLLNESCDELLGACEKATRSVGEWFTGVRSSSFGGKKQVERQRKERLDKIERVRDELNVVLDVFRKEKRFEFHLRPIISGTHV